MLSSVLLGLFIALVLNIGIFFIAFNYQTDKLTDITYASTFALLAAYFWYFSDGNNTTYKIALFLLPLIWAIRLGAYLFIRILTKGKDHRFDKFRHIFKRFFRFWLLQGMSVWIVSLPFIVGLTVSPESFEFSISDTWLIIGVTCWIFGFLIESIADYQKFRFRNNPENQGKFMDKGLFSIVRFPNYLGEMMVWISIFMLVAPVLQGLQWLVIISPLWICFLLLKVSGIPFLERSNKKRYGHLPDFQDYKANTKKLIPYIY